MKTSDFILIYDTYINRHLKPSTVKLYRNCLSNCIAPEFGACDLDKVKRAQVVEFHSRLHARPYIANRTVAIGRGMYSYAGIIEVVEETFNPFRKIRLYRESSRDRHLSRLEYRSILAALERLQNDKAITKYGAAGVKVLMLTGCRYSEIERLKWEDVRLEERTANLPDSKTGPRVVELTANVVEILKELKADANSPRVFPGKYRGTRISLRVVWEKVRNKIGLVDVRLHDLLHSFATLAASEGVPLPVIVRLLGHSKVWTTARYMHASRAMTAKAAHKVADLIIRS